MQNNLNQKIYRRHNIIQQNNNNNPYSNIQGGDNPYSYEANEQMDYANTNMINIPQQIISRNSYEQNKLHMNLKNQTSANSFNNNPGISPFINIIKEELENVINSNNSIVADIDKLESLDSDLIADRILLIEEVMEKKSNLILIKKEVEVKRGYLNSLMRIKKNKIEEIQKMKMIRLSKLIDNINESSENLNETAAEFKNLLGIDLKFLEVVNKEILVDLIKNS
jgi:hypothetical protein